MTRCWRGIPASAGDRIGLARWVLRYADLADLQAGDIMLSRMTSPDWVAAFERIGAIVTEQGGALCHAAVLAREMGIPAVVGVGRELREIQNGDIVRVNGGSGTVTIFAENQSELTSEDRAMKQALVVIDVQNIYTQPDGALAVDGAAEILDRINDLIRSFEANGKDVVFVRHVHRADGSDLGRMFDFAGEAEEPNFIEGTAEVEYDSRLYRPSGYPDLTKTRYSAFQGTGLSGILEAAQIDTLVVCGFMTNYCCEGTAREAHDRDYFVDFIMDATGCPDASDEVTQDVIKSIVGASLEGGIARVHSSREFLS